jgi:hypothetical protein
MMETYFLLKQQSHTAQSILGQLSTEHWLSDPGILHVVDSPLFRKSAKASTGFGDFSLPWREK